MTCRQFWTAPRPPSGATVAYPNSIEIGVNASDNVGVKSVDIVLDGVTTTKNSAPFQISYAAHRVSTRADHTVRFIARDYAGNTATVDTSFSEVPNVDSVPPTVAFTCLSPGALFPPGYAIPISVAATDNDQIDKVEFYLNTDTTPSQPTRPRRTRPPTLFRRMRRRARRSLSARRPTTSPATRRQRRRSRW